MSRGAVPSFDPCQVKTLFAEKYCSVVRAHVLGDAPHSDMVPWVVARLSVTNLVSYVDQNFKVTLRPEPGDTFQELSFVWRASNSSEAPAIVSAEANVMQRTRLAQNLTAVIPEPLTTDDGLLCSQSINPKTGDTHTTRLIRFLKGSTFVSCSPALKRHPLSLRSVGRVVGLIDRQLEGMRLDATVRFLRWDLKAADHLTMLVPFCVKEEERRGSIERWLQGFQELCKPLLAELPVQVLHADVNDHNVLVEELNGHLEVTGVVDFGDVVTSPAVCELAIALAYFIMFHETAEELLTSAMHLVCAYHAVKPLCSTELTLLWHLTAARLCTSITVSSYESVLQPENREYLEVSLQPACETLALMSTVPDQVASAALHHACGVEQDEAVLKILLASASGFQQTSTVLTMEQVRSAWTQSCAGISVDVPNVAKGRDVKEIIAFRAQHCSKALSIQWEGAPSGPPKIVRGRGTRLIAEDGTAYLDCVNNVCHVGHCHPSVVAAGCEQMATLNTNTRFLGDNIVDLTEELLKTFPKDLGLDTVIFVNSGSEANELAYRLATEYTGHHNMLVVDNAYHGNTTSLINISPYKYRSQGGRKQPAHLGIVPTPDIYRGDYQIKTMEEGPQRTTEEALCAKQYSDKVAERLEEMAAEGKDVAAFWVESLLGVGGNLVPPENWLEQSFAHAKAKGCLCIADEIQVGFGRVGTHWWGFQSQGGDVRPDIVTLGKPMGNGHPLAAVVTKKCIAEKFTGSGIEYFNSFGGNPVSMAIGRAVLGVIKSEKLMENAETTGRYFQSSLHRMQTRHPELAHIRGKGLFMGVDLVKCQKTREPWPHAAELTYKMKDKKILITLDGPHKCALKIKPAIVFSPADVDLFCTALDEVMTEIKMSHGETVN